MSSESASNQPITASIAPWLSVANATRAVNYYKAAFGAVELELLEDEPGNIAVAHLSVNGATFWVQHDPAASPDTLGGKSPVRMILTVADPDSMFEQAVKAGGTVIVPMNEGNGWRVGRIVDPCGHHWEIGKPLSS